MTPCTLTHLTDHELIAAVARLAQSERATTSDLVAHLAEFDARDLHLAAGYSSLFSYCCEVLHLSEHEAYNRIEAARASRRFPMPLEALAAGRVNLTTVRLLAPHLTSGNHLELLEAAAHLKRRQVEELIASRFPRPDIATSIRRLPKRPVPLAMTAAPTEGLPGTEVVSMPGSIARLERPAPPFSGLRRWCRWRRSARTTLHRDRRNADQAARSAGPVTPCDSQRRCRADLRSRPESAARRSAPQESGGVAVPADMPGQALPVRATSRPRCGGPCGAATRDGARSWRREAAGAPRRLSSSSTTSSLTRPEVRPRQTTSRSAVAPTTRTKPDSSSRR